jgi:hypothetical protein
MPQQAAESAQDRVQIDRNLSRDTRKKAKAQDIAKSHLISGALDLFFT